MRRKKSQRRRDRMVQPMYQLIRAIVRKALRAEVVMDPEGKVRGVKESMASR